jgi:DNA-directed RNA polymerase specialized sigma24 family protein
LSVRSTYQEGELVSLLQQKDNGAFSYLYDHYAGALQGIVKQIVGEESLSEDVVQEVFVSIWRKIDSYDPQKGRLFTWMLNVARNAAIDKVRSRSFQQGLKQKSLDGTELHHPVVRPVGDDVGLRRQLLKLKDEQRQLIDLSYYQGFTHDQIAKELNIPLGTVKTRLRSALSQLRTLLS